MENEETTMDPQEYFSDMNYFSVNVSEYDATKDFVVTRPASLERPKNHAVMFIMEEYIEKYAHTFEDVDDCLVFCPPGGDGCSHERTKAMSLSNATIVNLNFADFSSVME